MPLYAAQLACGDSCTGVSGWQEASRKLPQSLQAAAEPAVDIDFELLEELSDILLIKEQSVDVQVPLLGLT
jgi:hypothetical protein